MSARAPRYAQSLALGWPLLLVVAGAPIACNALWGLDGLSYDGRSEGGSAAGGSGAGGATTTSGGAGGELVDASSDATSEPVWVEQTLVFGERAEADVTGVTGDTHIKNDQGESSLNFGAGTGFGPDADPHRVALLRFDLTSLPVETVVYEAEVELFVAACNNCHAEAGTVQVYELLEDWTEGSQVGAAGSANYLQRLAGTPWTAVGAGTGSRDTTVLVDFDPNVQGQAFSAALPVALVQGWVADPASNFGLCLESTPTTNDGVIFVSRESDLVDQRPILRITALVPQ